MRRRAIICQLGHKSDTDTALLADCIGPQLGVTPSDANERFFVRKAIGWALREYAKTDPEWVRTYVDEHAGGLASLTVREALKHL